MKKPMKPQPQTPEASQERDCFGTPFYAFKLLTPFLDPGRRIGYDPACGLKYLAKAMGTWFGDVPTGDIDPKYNPAVLANFLTYNFKVVNPSHWMIVTNPPYSISKKFYEKCMDIWVAQGIPFALLIRTDWNQWNIKATQNGAEWVIPTRRINFITPSGKSGDESQAHFHTGWLTQGLEIGRPVTFAPLSEKDLELIEVPKG